VECGSLLPLFSSEACLARSEDFAVSESTSRQAAALQSSQIVLARRNESFPAISIAEIHRLSNHVDAPAQLCDHVGSFRGAYQMNRRNFLAASLASAAAGAVASVAQAQDTAAGARDYYELRRYHLLTPQRKLADAYFQNALIPGLNRLGIQNVGVFNVSIGAESPSMYVLIPSTSLDALVGAGARLSAQAQ